jgi:hypothetical protein
MKYVPHRQFNKWWRLLDFTGYENNGVLNFSKTHTSRMKDPESSLVVPYTLARSHHTAAGGVMLLHSVNLLD